MLRVSHDTVFASRDGEGGGVERGGGVSMFGYMHDIMHIIPMPHAVTYDTSKYCCTCFFSLLFFSRHSGWADVSAERV